MHEAALIERRPTGDGPGGRALLHLPAASRLRAGEHPRGAVFLDRDGVLIEDAHYLRRPEDLRLLPGVADALRALAPSHALVVITNQSGVARGYLDEATLHAIHVRLLEALAAEGAFVDAIYACPHLDDGCDCRKPAPGMILRAAREHGLALDRSCMIGDAPRDVEAGRRAGVRSLLFEAAEDGWSEALRWIR